MTAATMPDLPLPVYAELPAHIRQWAPGGRTVHDLIPLGIREDGEPYGLPVWTRSHGAFHILVAGTTGSGKTNTINDILAGLAACGDGLTWYIEVAKKGKAAAPWLPVLDWVAPDLDEAERMLAAGVAAIETRSAELGRRAVAGDSEDKWIPTPEEPLITIVVDEAAWVFGPATGISKVAEQSARCVEYAKAIAQTGRELGVNLIVATQRPSVPTMGGDGDFLAQFYPGICLRMRKRSEIQFVIPNADLDQMDTTLFDRPGMLFVHDGAADAGMGALAVRSYALYNQADAARVAQAMEPGQPLLDLGTAVGLGDLYTGRCRNPWGTEAVSVVKPHQSAAPAAQLGTTGRTTADDRYATARAELAELANDVAAEPPTQLRQVRLVDSPAAPVDELPPAPPSTVRTAVLEALAAAGEDGATRAELETIVEASKSHVSRVLRELVDAGEVIRIKTAKNRYRYQLPTPSSPHQAADQAEAQS